MAQQTLHLTQAECREMALSFSEKLEQSDNALRQAELDRQIAKTAFLPAFDASANGIYGLPDADMEGMKLRMRGTYTAGINLIQPLYTGGKIMTGQHLAQIGKETAAEQHRMTRMDVLVEADNAYWTYIAVGQKVKMLEIYHRQMDTLYSQIQAALEAGMAIENDLLRIEAKRTEIHYQLQKVQNGTDLCRMSLCQVVGAGFDTPIEAVDTTFTVSEPGLLASDIYARPELSLLDKQVAAGKEQIHMARAEMLPTVGLTANYMYYGNLKLNGMTDDGSGAMVPYSQEYRDGMGMLMLSVKIPLFHWGENLKKVDKARYELRNSELELQRNTRLISIEAQQAVRNVQDGYRLIHTAEKGLRQAEENLRVTGNRYAESMAPLIDLLDAQSQWQQARSNLIEAQTQYKIYETQYLRAVGKLE
ncbi:MAG: TolC family protein [Mangrovibacterium sp.]